MREFGRALAIPWHDSMPPDAKERVIQGCWQTLRHNYDWTRERHPEYGLSGVCELRDGPIEPEWEYEACPAILPSHDYCDLCEGAERIPVRIIPGRFVRLVAWYEMVEVS